jgi:hypothetical protein
MCGVHVIESDLPVGSDSFDATVVYIRRGEQRKARMLVSVIIPGKELLTPGPRMAGRAKVFWVVRLVLERLELGLREGVVVAHMRTTEAANHPQDSEELSEALGAHRRAAIGMDREHSWLDAVTGHGLRKEVLRQLGALAFGEQPTYRHATEEVQDNIQAIEQSWQRSTQLRDIPRPDLVRRGCQEGWLDMLAWRTLGATRRAFACCGEKTVHRAD